MVPVILRKGLGKDGNPNIQYVKDHPTNYDWVPRVERVAKRLVNMPEFKYKIWINTYYKHPPYWERDKTSFDVWGYGGRGAAIGDIGHSVFQTLFNDPNPPDIWWTIWNGWMWTRQGGWEHAPSGPVDSDPNHFLHIHVTYLDYPDQVALRRGM